MKDQIIFWSVNLFRHQTPLLALKSHPIWYNFIHQGHLIFFIVGAQLSEIEIFINKLSTQIDLNQKFNPNLFEDMRSNDVFLALTKDPTLDQQFSAQFQATCDYAQEKAQFINPKMTFGDALKKVKNFITSINKEEKFNLSLTATQQQASRYMTLLSAVGACKEYLDMPSVSSFAYAVFWIFAILLDIKSDDLSNTPR